MGTRSNRKKGGRYTRRLLHGGSEDILKFQYTTRKRRIKWVKAMYPLGNLILAAIKEIDWSEYSYDGLAQFIVEDVDTINNGFHLGNQKMTEGTVRIEASTQSIPYYVLGGAACELWNKAYPKAGDLHKTTDPTADIDIRVAIPKFKVKDTKIMNKYGDVSVKIMDGNSYTAFADHYSRWLYEAAIGVAKKIAPFFGDSLFTAPEKDEMDETSVSDLHRTVGPILISRMYRNDMLKIQMSTKLRGSSQVADHFVEFIVVTKEPSIGNDNEFKSTTTKIDGIYIQNVYPLMLDQIKAVEGRLAAEEEIRYKLVNHYGRLLYLSHLLEYTIREKVHNPLIAFQYKQLTDIVKKGLFDPQAGACPPPKGCSAEAYLAPLCKIRTFKDGFPTMC